VNCWREQKCCQTDRAVFQFILVHNHSISN
jgi:hypothetical protein